MKSLLRKVPARVHQAWLAVGITFLVMLGAAAVRATPSVLIVPLEHAFGWSPATISLAISFNLVLFGLLGPFTAALMQRFGIRPTVLGALVLVDAAFALSTQMTAPWQLFLTWGLLVGTGCGVLAPVLGASVVNRWFTTRRGLAIGIITASSAAGQLVFLPLLANIAESTGWQPTVWTVVVALAALIPIVALLLPERPSDLGILPYGDTGERPAAAAAAVNPLVTAFTVLGRAAKSGNFWILAASFMVCGTSTNGLVGTHLIPYCFDNGIPEVRAAGLLAAMGAFNIIGTTLSGWLTDRFDSRVLLMFYYGLRGLSLLYLPYSSFSFYTLTIFAMFYGLDWIATVPPTMKLITETFGKPDTPVVFGWLFVGHQIGAATIALLAGAMRTDLGTYLPPFMLSGTLCIAAAIFVLRIGRTPRATGTLAPAAAQ